ncbi:ATP-binding protein [Nocardiopsis mangrovi]|uniref:ATP-binding protein n=1 Tax=Nocardiopsis mangrovi TaxID=1179818 RepID=A0ABV9DX91_9ACTN
MTAHSAYFRADGPFLQANGLRTSLRPGRGDETRGWRGLPVAPLPVGGHFIRSASAVRGLGFHPASVKDARDFAATVLGGWGLLGLSSDIRLVASELVTNACRHAAPSVAGMLADWSIQFGLTRAASSVTCMVFDPSRRAPVMGDPGDLHEGGRGLRLIECYSANWGWDVLDGQGKVVWATFAIPGAS